MSKRIRRALYAVLAAVLVSGGTATLTHAWDAQRAAQRAAQAQLTDYNDGFTDGVCTGSVRTAHDAYGITCR